MAEHIIKLHSVYLDGDYINLVCSCGWRDSVPGGITIGEIHRVLYTHYSNVDPPRVITDMRLLSFGPVLYPPHPEWAVRAVIGEYGEGKALFPVVLNINVPEDTALLVNHAGEIIRVIKFKEE